MRAADDGMRAGRDDPCPLARAAGSGGGGEPGPREDGAGGRDANGDARGGPSPRPAFRVPLRAALLVLAYVGLLAVLLFSSEPSIDAGALLALVTVALAPALVRRSRSAWAIWSITMLVGGTLLAIGRAGLLPDLFPFAIGAGLCALFAASLRPHRRPFVARAIIATDGPQRLAQPGVAAYARGLTAAWTVFFAAQAAVALVVVLFAHPDGLLAGFGIAVPRVLTRADASAIHLGGIAAVFAFFALEYAYRRWHLRHVPHLPVHVFFARLARRWPELVRADDAGAPAAPAGTRDWSTTFHVPAAHPSLPGHFPGNPVVPGVVLLDRVAAALEEAGGGGLRRIASVKFLAPLRAGCEVGLRLQVDDRRVRFAMQSNGRILLRGEGERA